MASPLNTLRELQRREATQDDNFYKKFLYYFEMRVPGSLGGVTSFYFPLVLNPTSYSLDEPFAVEATPTQGGGLYVEENGIVMRTIRIEGNTGFAPRRLARQPWTLGAIPPDQRSYSRTLPSVALDLISGQRHFQYLQDALFRTYADLKRDPATSLDTRLIFHVPKDDEHWLVTPKMFQLQRDSSKPMIYSYSIELLVVDRADRDLVDFSEDKSVLDAIKDTVRAIKNGIDLISGGLQDLSGLLADLTSTIKNAQQIIDSATQIARAGSDFVDGLTNAVNIPFAFLQSTSELIDAGIMGWSKAYNFPGTTAKKIKDLPIVVEQLLRQIQRGTYQMAAHPVAFANTVDTTMQILTNTRASEAQVAAAEAATPPRSFAAVASMGTAPLPGDALRAGVVGPEAPAKKYTGTQSHTVGQGDTLANLAGRYLGDARLWTHIAVMNGLRPPFITAQANADLSTVDKSPVPGTVGIGRTLQIPNYRQPPSAQPLLPVLGARREASAEEQFLGRDLALAKLPSGLYDMVMDTELGGTDLKTVSGIANVTQALVQRLETEKGSDPLFRTVGMAPIVALNIGVVDVETARFRVVEALSADPRVAAVRKVAFGQEGPDTLIIDADVELRGFAEASHVQVKV